MQVRPQRWPSLRGSILYDDDLPACSTRKQECIDYGGAQGSGAVQGDDCDAGLDATTPRSNESYEERDAQLARSTSDQILEPTGTPSPILSQPMPALYRKAEMVFEGLDYFNKMICPDLVSLESHFNPYRVNLQTIKWVPDIYIKVLVSVANFHKLMLIGPESSLSAALIQRDVNIFQLRLDALKGLTKRLSLPDQQTDDATLLCVLAFMIASTQASPFTEWRQHLEGARRIIQLRGGLRKIITVNPYFKPVLTFFMIIDIMGATTMPSTHFDMPSACTMAMEYWGVDPSLLQLVATTCIPCPDVLCQVLILVNFLRTVAHKDHMQLRRRSGTKMAIKKVMSFSPIEYSARMQYFNGWSTSGKEVSFITRHASPGTTTNSPLSSDDQLSSESLPAPQSSLKNYGSLWLSIGVAYRSSILLYTLRTLVFDYKENLSLLVPEEFRVDVQTLRQKTFQILHSILVPIFADSVSMREMGKLTMWPLFMLGMETDYRDVQLRSFVTDGFSGLSQALGTMGPIGIVGKLETKWKIDAEREGLGVYVKWDDYFQCKDFIVF